MADHFLFLDDVQFSKGSFTNRVQIKSGDKIGWLTIPLKNSGSFKRINELQTSNENWREQHLEQLKLAYRSAPFVEDLLKLVKSVYEIENLCDLLIASIEQSAAYLGICAGQLRARTSGLGIAGTSSTRVLELVQYCNGNRYITGHGASNYLQHEEFEKNGISVEYMAYSKTEWQQQTGPFTPFVSILDLIANMGRSGVSCLHPATVEWRSHLKGTKLND